MSPSILRMKQAEHLSPAYLHPQTSAQIPVSLRLWHIFGVPRGAWGACPQHPSTKDLYITVEESCIPQGWQQQGCQENAYHRTALLPNPETDMMLLTFFSCVIRAIWKSGVLLGSSGYVETKLILGKRRQKWERPGWAGEINRVSLIKRVVKLLEWSFRKLIAGNCEIAAVSTDVRHTNTWFQKELLF